METLCMSHGISQQVHLPAAGALRRSWKRQRTVIACNARHSEAQGQVAGLAQRVLSGVCAAALATAVSLAPLDCTALPAHAEALTVSNDTPVLDLAKLVPAGRVDELQQRIKQLESDTGYRVRVFTRFGGAGRGDEEVIDSLRKGWSTDESTVVAVIDPSASNIMSFSFGMDVQKVLRRPYFTELKSRFGNLFYVRDQGESAAVLNMLDTLLTSLEHPEACIAQGGCRQVPGVSLDMYYLTLACSIAGGLVVGFVNKLEPQGWVQRKWVWQLLFAPLSASLFINFGLGPILTRTSDPLPILGNVAGFALAAALVIVFAPALAKASGLTEAGPNSDA